MLSQNEIYELKRNFAYILLMFECDKGIYDGIRTVYEHGKINNNMIIQELKKDRMVNTTPQTTIFYDMISVAYTLSRDNPSIIMAIEQYCKTNYSTVNEIIDMFANKSLDGISSIKEAVDTVHMLMDADSESGNPEEMAYLFLMFSSDKLNQNGTLEEFHIVAKAVSDRFRLTKEAEKLDKMFSDTNEGENIFETKQYQRWYKKRREALCDYFYKIYGLPAKEKNLEDLLEGILAPFDDEEGIPMGIAVTEGYVPSWITRQLIVSHHGGLEWINRLVRDNNIDPVEYMPDMNVILESYYKTVVSYESIKQNIEKGEALTRYQLAREFTTDPEDDVKNLAYLYNIDILLKMFDEMVEEYYKNFSWEQIAHKPLLARYQNTISDLQRQLNQQEGKVKSLSEENISLKNQVLSNSDSVTRPYIEENLSLMKKLEDRDEEITRLKARMQSMEELLSLQAVEDKDEAADVDIINLDNLRTRRYLFVGYDVPAMKELRKQFPDSLFMESETFNINNNIAVDAVVILIRNLSHSMYYKVISSKHLMDLPIVRVNTRNINTIYRAMQAL